MFSLTSTAKLLETEVEPRNVLKISSIKTVKSPGKAAPPGSAGFIHGPAGGISDMFHAATGRMGTWSSPGNACNSEPYGCCANVATLPAPRTNFTFLVLVFSASEDSVSFSCLPTDEGLSSMLSCSSFPALAKEQNKPITSEQWQRKEGTPRGKECY